MLLDQEVRKRGDAEPGDGRSSKGDAVIGLEPASWMNRDHPVAIGEAPAFRALHECLVRKELFRRLGCAMCPDIVRARDELAMQRRHATRDQVRIAEVADTDRAVESLRHDVDE